MYYKFSCIIRIYFVCTVGIVSVICLFVCLFFFFTACNVSFCKKKKKKRKKEGRYELGSLGKHLILVNRCKKVH